MIEWSAVVGYINNPNLAMHINDISHKINLLREGLSCCTPEN